MNLPAERFRLVFRERTVGRIPGRVIAKMALPGDWFARSQTGTLPQLESPVVRAGLIEVYEVVELTSRRVILRGKAGPRGFGADVTFDNPVVAAETTISLKTMRIFTP